MTTHTETISDRYKAELIHRRATSKTTTVVELAMLEWIGWFNRRR